MSRSSFTPLHKGLEATLDRLGLEGGLASVLIPRVWPQVVGEEVARRTHPGLLRQGRLQVIVGDSVWLQQLTMLKPAILAGLASHLGSRIVRDIFFTLGTPPAPPARPQSGSRTADASLSPELEKRLEEVLRPVRDPECRDVLARILIQAWRAD